MMMSSLFWSVPQRGILRMQGSRNRSLEKTRICIILRFAYVYTANAQEMRRKSSE